MELFHLRYFVAVAEELNFSQAARKLHMAASPLSRRIRDLEHDLRQQLFHRTTHTVELTPAGQALLPLARDVLDRAGAIPWRLRDAARTEGPVLAGVAHGTPPDLRARLRRLVERCRHQFKIELWTGSDAGLSCAVHDRRLAFAIARLPVSDPALEVVELTTEPLGAVVPADRFTARNAVHPADLAGLPYVAPPGADEDAADYFEEIDVRLRTAGIWKRIRSSSDDWADIGRLVSDGAAFSLSSLDRARPPKTRRLGNVALLPFEDFDPRPAIGLVWRRDSAVPGADWEPLVKAALDAFDCTMPHREHP